MKKMLLVLLLSLCLLCGLALTATAATHRYVVFDDAGLLTYEQETAIKNKADTAMAKIDNIEIAVIVTDEFNSNYTDAMYKTSVLTSNSDLMLLVIYYDEWRSYYEYEVVTFGKMQSGISASRQDYIADEIYSDVKSGNLQVAINTFIDLTVEEYQPQKTIRVPKIIGIAVGVGAVGALIAVLCVVISYRRKNRSPSYPLKEFTNMHLTVANDVCTGRTVTKVRLSSSSGSSGGGGGHHGGGGRSSGRR